MAVFFLKFSDGFFETVWERAAEIRCDIKSDDMHKNIEQKLFFRHDPCIFYRQHLVELQVKQYPVQYAAQACYDIAGFFVEDDARGKYREDQCERKQTFYSPGNVNEADFSNHIE